MTQAIIFLLAIAFLVSCLVVGCQREENRIALEDQRIAQQYIQGN